MKSAISAEKKDVMVSIIMPVYNAGIFLRDALNDVLLQTYQNIEIIVIDDGSTDRSLELLRYFETIDERVRVISQGNRGAGYSRNTGIKEAKGDYLLFLDSDDRFELKMIESAVERALNTDADIVVFDGRSFDSDTEIYMNEFMINREYHIPVDTFNYKDLDPKEIFGFSASCVWNKLYKSKFIKQNGLYFKNTKYMNDVYFALISVVMASRISVICENLVSYRKGNPQSVSGGSNRDRFPECTFEVLWSVQEKLVQLGIYDSVKKSFAKYSYDMIVGHLVNYGDENNYKKFLTLLNIETAVKMGFDSIERNDFPGLDIYDDLRCLMEKGCHDFVIRIIGRNGRYLYWELNAKKLHLLNNDYHEKERCFNIRRIPLGSRIVLYGAGRCGKYIWKQNCITQKYKICLWVDRNAEAFKSEYEHIQLPEKIRDTKCDYVIIAADTVKVMKEIREYLLGLVKPECIVW